MPKLSILGSNCIQNQLSTVTPDMGWYHLSKSIYLVFESDQSASHQLANTTHLGQENKALNLAATHHLE